DVLKIGLQLPPAGELEPIGQLEDRLARPDRMKLPGEAHDIAIKRPGRIADAGIADGKAELIVGAAERSFKSQPAIKIEIDQVAIAGGAHRPAEQGKAGLFGLVDQEWLIDDAVQAEIIVVLPRPAIAVGARQRDAIRVEMQIAKPLGMPPAAKTVSRIPFRAFRVVAELVDDERAVICATRSARRIAQLRTAHARS